MQARLVVLALTLAVVGALLASTSALAQAPGGLTIPNVTGSLARGGQLTGAVTITRLTYRPGGLTADGTLSGTATSPADATGLATPPAGQSAAVAQGFRDIPLTLADPTGGVCESLTIDLGTVFLDQLGQQVDPAPTALDLASLPRAGLSQGMLLCAVANQLEAAPSGSQLGLVNELVPVVNRALGGGR